METRSRERQEDHPKWGIPEAFLDLTVINLHITGIPFLTMFYHYNGSETDELSADELSGSHADELSTDELSADDARTSDVPSMTGVAVDEAYSAPAASVT